MQFQSSDMVKSIYFNDIRNTIIDKRILGIDEAGRGSLAGPVFVAGVVLPNDFNHPLLKDSKKLTVTERSHMFEIILDEALFLTILSSDNNDIDNYGIAHTIYSLVNQIYQETPLEYFDIAIFDGNIDPIKKSNSLCCIKGDNYIKAISAASLCAKVTRDAFMIQIASDYPNFSFAQHKGYGTKKHISEIFTHGYSNFHRHTFKIHKKI